MLATASPILPSAAILKVYEALKSIEIKTILDFKRQSDKQLVSIHEDTSLVLALDQMKSNNILAAPIYRYIKHNDIDGKEDEAGQGILKEYTGIVSVYDCVAQIAFQKVFEAFDPVTGAIKDSSAFKDYLDIWKEEEEAMGISVKEGKNRRSWSTTTTRISHFK